MNSSFNDLKISDDSDSDLMKMAKVCNHLLMIDNHISTTHLFKKYPKIHKCPSTDREGNWYGFEKLHGSNMALIVKKDNMLSYAKKPPCVTFARRNAVIEDYKLFYDFKNIRNGLIEAGRNLFERLSTCYESLQYIQIYGELYGGDKIQRHIKYSKDVQYSVFDIRITYDNNTIWLSYEDFNMVTDSGFSIVPIMFKGPYSQILKNSPEFKSAFSDFKDQAEGYVVKKITDGNLYAYKNKAPSFQEKFNARGTKIKKVQPIKKTIDIPDILDYFTDNRMDAVRSKELNNITATELARLFVIDAADEYKEDHPDVIPKLIRGAAFKHYNKALIIAKRAITKEENKENPMSVPLSSNISIDHTNADISALITMLDV